MVHDLLVLIWNNLSMNSAKVRVVDCVVRSPNINFIAKTQIHFSVSGERGEEGAGGKRRVCLETDPDSFHGRWRMKPGDETWKDILKPGGFCSAKTGGGGEEVKCSAERMNRDLVMGKREKLVEGRERKGSSMWWEEDKQQSLKLQRRVIGEKKQSYSYMDERL